MNYDSYRNDGMTVQGSCGVAIDIITVKQLLSLSKCSNAFTFGKLGVSRKGFEKHTFIKEVIKSMKELFVIYDNMQDVLEDVREIFQVGYKREWFSCETQFLVNKERDFARFERLIRYMDDNGYKVYLIDQPVNIDLKSPLEYKGYNINTISGTVDMVIGKDDKRVAVNLDIGKTEYSYMARKESNKVINALSLVTTYLGIFYRYRGHKVIVANWYLANKDDKGSLLVENFDQKRGSNIIEYDYSNMDVKDVYSLFLKVLGFPEQTHKCDSCFHNDICKINKNVWTDVSLDSKDSSVANEKKEEKSITFTDAQKEVVNHLEGPMGVIAVPGAGKTFSLVNRLVNLIEKGVEPSSILFVTFTNKAAKEIEERVTKVLSLRQAVEKNKKPIISTFNGLGFCILKENPMYIGQRVKLATEVDRLSLISKMIEKAPRIERVSYDGIYTEYGLVRQLDSLFMEIEKDGEDAFIKKYKEKKDVVNILIAYHLFDEEYRGNGFIDFDMQISLVNGLFEKYPQLAKSYAKKYKYIMVDEFQDSSQAQVDMIYAIAKQHNNIVIVGDDDQSIYSFRGGSNEFMLNFSNDFPGAKMVYMEDNFRSNNLILNVGISLIANNKNRYEKRFISHSSSKYKPIYFKGYDKGFVSNLVQKSLAGGYFPGDIAVISRNNKSLYEIQEVLEGVVNVALPKDYLVKDTVFTAIYDILTLYYEGLDNDVSFYRYLAYHNSERYCQKENKEFSIYQNLINANKLLPIDKMDIECMKKYYDNMSKSILMKEGYRLISCFKAIQYSKGIRDAIGKIIDLMYGFKEHKVIDSLCDMADERAIVTIKELYSLMYNMVLFQVDSRVGYNVSKDALNLLTAHDSKGKEFKVVIIYAMEDFKDDEEEIRLLYVAQTRAMKSLFMIESPYNNCEVLDFFKEDVVINEC